MDVRRIARSRRDEKWTTVCLEEGDGVDPGAPAASGGRFY